MISTWHTWRSGSTIGQFTWPTQENNNKSPYWTMVSSHLVLDQKNGSQTCPWCTYLYEEIGWSSSSRPALTFRRSRHHRRSTLLCSLPRSRCSLLASGRRKELKYRGPKYVTIASRGLSWHQMYHNSQISLPTWGTKFYMWPMDRLPKERTIAL